MILPMNSCRHLRGAYDQNDVEESKLDHIQQDQEAGPAIVAELNELCQSNKLLIDHHHIHTSTKIDRILTNKKINFNITNQHLLN